MGNNNITIKLKSYKITGQIVTVLLSSALIISLLFYISITAPVFFASEAANFQGVFGFITLVILGLTIPAVLLAAVLKTLIISSELTMDDQGSELVLFIRNKLTGSVREKFRIPTKELKELVAIRIKTDEEGIANQYHLFAGISSGDPVKIHTFTKFYYVFRFGREILNRTSIAWLDWTERTFDREKDFIDSYILNLSGYKHHD